MDAFIVVMDPEGADRSSSVKERLQERYDEFYEFSPTCFLVASDALTEDIAKAAGIKGEGGIESATGAVFKISGYSGFTSRSLWEWLSKVGA